MLTLQPVINIDQAVTHQRYLSINGRVWPGHGASPLNVSPQQKAHNRQKHHRSPAELGEESRSTRSGWGFGSGGLAVGWKVGTPPDSGGSENSIVHYESDDIGNRSENNALFWGGANRQ